MVFESLKHFLLMDGHGPFVWASYGFWFVMLCGLWWHSYASRCKVRQIVSDYWEDVSANE